MNSITVNGRRYTEMCFVRGVTVLTDDDLAAITDEELVALMAQLKDFRFTETYHPDIPAENIRLVWNTEIDALYVEAQEELCD